MASLVAAQGELHEADGVEELVLERRVRIARRARTPPPAFAAARSSPSTWVVAQANATSSASGSSG